MKNHQIILEYIFVTKIKSKAIAVKWLCNVGNNGLTCALYNASFPFFLILRNGWKIYVNLYDLRDMDLKISFCFRLLDVLGLEGLYDRKNNVRQGKTRYLEINNTYTFITLYFTTNKT